MTARWSRPSIPKVKLVHQQRWATREEAWRDLLGYIGAYNNRRRSHSPVSHARAHGEEGGLTQSSMKSADDNVPAMDLRIQSLHTIPDRQRDPEGFRPSNWVVFRVTIRFRSEEYHHGCSEPC